MAQAHQAGQRRPILAVTMGDPAGIGPEIVLGAWRDPAVHAACVPVVVGDVGVLERCAALLGQRRPACEVVSCAAEARALGDIERVPVLQVPVAGIERVRPGVIGAAAGRAADAYVRRACELALAGEVAGIVTAPIHKGALRLAGVEHIGHTEMLAARLDSPDPLTLFVTGPMRIFFLTRHLSLRQAVDAVTEERVHAFILRVDAALRDLGLRRPSLGLAALNPHAGDGGQFGDEERLHLEPAVARARAAGVDVAGPIGADSVFHMALEGRFDAALSLYHDQGHIAAKTRDFFGTITATLGLPVMRTSVDHGTAHDIAWQGKAESVSLRRAILAAVELLGAGLDETG